MCRLYGFRANEPTKVECTLVHAQNALLVQSRSDLRGVSHTDGWGIACYSGAQPQVERRDAAAYDDVHFSETAERIYAHTVIAHVRRATVGGPSTLNTHPFRYRHWAFAHNGTVTAFEKIRAEMEQETSSALQRHRQGTTDSEQIFYWLLTRLEAAGIDPHRRGSELGVIGAVLADSVQRLASWCDEAGTEEPAKLNLLLTDGKLLVASRWNNTLHRVERIGVHDCEICGIPHVHHQQGQRYRAVVVASEPISDEPWQAIPQGHLVSVDAESRLNTFAI